MKLIFLDIDGVLNSEIDFILSGNKEYFVDIAPRPMKLLNALIEETSAKVVISSTWRNNKTIPELQEILNEKGFIGEVVGATPRLGKDSLRGNEIFTWIKDNEEFIGKPYYEFTDYIILDDDSDMLYWQKNNFIHVDGYVGLTPNVIHKAKRFLNNRSS